MSLRKRIFLWWRADWPGWCCWWASRRSSCCKARGSSTRCGSCIIGTVETATGGRVEVASFRFDWKQLRAEVRGFVLHGTETADKPPLFRAESVVVDLKLVSILRQDVDIQSLTVSESSRLSDHRRRRPHQRSRAEGASHQQDFHHGRYSQAGHRPLQPGARHLRGGGAHPHSFRLSRREPERPAWRTTCLARAIAARCPSNPCMPATTITARRRLR